MDEQPPEVELIRDWLDRLFAYLNDPEGVRRRQVHELVEHGYTGRTGHPLDIPRALANELTDSLVPAAERAGFVGLAAQLKTAREQLNAVCHEISRCSRGIGKWAGRSLSIYSPSLPDLVNDDIDRIVVELRRSYRAASSLLEAAIESRAASEGEGDETPDARGRPSKKALCIELYRLRRARGISVSEFITEEAEEISNMAKIERGEDVHADTARKHIRDLFREDQRRKATK